MEEIDLGFAEERERVWLTNRYFPSKIGGKPAWLDLEQLPTKQTLECSQCQQPKSFICQVYAPYDDEHSFHRTVYIFACRSENCQVVNDNSNFTVLRSQLPKVNKFYSSSPPTENSDPLPAIPTKNKLCLVCGCLGPYACSRCNNANYCSVQHQRAHYPQHKRKCSTTNSNTKEEDTTEHSKLIYPEFEIVTETFEVEKTKDKDDASELEAEKQRLAEFEKLANDGKTGALKDVNDTELDKYASGAEAVDDKFFLFFKNSISKEPEQVIRYKRGGEPLWIANPEESIGSQLSTIPNCEYCGSERQFEFQIMPQMLNILKDTTLDWGVVAVYTCKASCEPPAHLAYLLEYVIKQDVSANKPD